jgi:hypothetical protein
MGSCFSKASAGTLFMPKFHCSYLTNYAKITVDPSVLKDNQKYDGISSFIPYPCAVDDYVTNKRAKFNKTSKIFKVHKIVNHEVVLLDFNDAGMEKDTFQKEVLNYKKKEGKYEYTYVSVDGGSAHLEGPMHKLTETYGKDIPYFTRNEIAHERKIIKCIAKRNLV